MAKMIVNNAAGLFLPGAEAVSAHGQEVDADTDNAAVAGWVKAGLLVKPKDFAKPVAASADPAMKAALEQAQADLTARDAIIADQAKQIEARDAIIADQAKQIKALTADLAAATKPAAT